MAQDELFAILLRLSDAKAVIETAVLVLESGDMPPEVVTARHGMKLLSAAYDELDSAIGRISG